MAVNDLQCPNCGAQVDFAGRAQATCSFCQSKLFLEDDGVKVHSALSDLLEGKPPAPGGIDVDQIRELARAGKKIDAIKLVREQTGLGLKEAKDAVEAIERGELVELTWASSAAAAPGPYALDLAPITAAVNAGKKIEAIKLYRQQTGVGLKEAKDAVEALEQGEMPVVTIDQRHGGSVPSSTRTMNSRLGCLGCLPMLLFIGLCAGLIMLSSQVGFRVWGPLDQALNILNNNAQVTQIFGQPLTVGPFITGSISGGDTSSSAHFSVPLYGPQHSGTLRVSGSWRRGVWDISINLAYDDEDGEEQTIYIAQKVK